MPKRRIDLPDAGAIRRTLNVIEGGAGSFELLTHDGPDPHEPGQPLCAIVRSTESKRVYLLVHEDDPSAMRWRQRYEIIGFDGLRQQLRPRRVASLQRKTGKRRRTA